MVPLEDENCPRAMGILTNTRLSAWHLRPLHQLLTPTWPLSLPLLPILTLHVTHLFIHLFTHSFTR